MTTHTEQPRALYLRLVEMCEQIASGNLDKAKGIFDFLLTPELDEPTKVLAEAFAMMAVRIEAREFERERLLKEIFVAREELDKHRGRLAVENRRLRTRVREQASSGRIIGQDPAMRSLLDLAERLALTRSNVLITGETGSGKGVLARHIHDLGPRAGKAFVDINCAAIPESLIESELFGIESGVASGVQARIGRFEQASGGTLLLDEIGDMPLESQAKILHVIENGVVERVGGRKRIPVDVRIMAATHRNLEHLVEQRQFRSDLFYRLNVVRLHVPPLRERPDDIPMLARSVLNELAARSQDAPQRISPEALQLLMRHNWPGNIREFQNVLERACLTAEGQRITEQDLAPALLPRGAALEAENMDSPDRDDADQIDSGLVDANATLEEAMAAHIKKVLRLNAGNKSHAARMLGISREGLRIKLARLGL